MRRGVRACCRPCLVRSWAPAPLRIRAPHKRWRTLWRQQRTGTAQNAKRLCLDRSLFASSAARPSRKTGSGRSGKARGAAAAPSLHTSPSCSWLEPMCPLQRARQQPPWLPHAKATSGAGPRHRQQRLRCQKELLLTPLFPLQLHRTGRRAWSPPQHAEAQASKSFCFPSRLLCSTQVRARRTARRGRLRRQTPSSRPSGQSCPSLIGSKPFHDSPRCLRGERREHVHVHQLCMCSRMSMRFVGLPSGECAHAAQTPSADA